MAKAIWNGTVLADSDDVVRVDGKVYFPRDAVDFTHLAESPHTSVCHWKGTANYFTVEVDGSENRDAAWHYPDPSPAAADLRDRIAFWRGVEIVTDDGARSGSGLLGRLRQRVTRGGEARPSDTAASEAQPSTDTSMDATPAPVVDLDDDTFEHGTEGGWTVVDFWAPWCGPCRAFHPIFDEMARTDDRIRFARCNVDEATRTASLVGVLSIPTVVLFDPDGNEVERIVGVPSRRAFDKLLDLGRQPTT